MKRLAGFMMILSFLIRGNSVQPIFVDRGCEITDFSMNPTDPYIVGDNVILSGKSTCGTVRFEINGEARSETGQPNQTMTWKTNEWGSGNFDVCFVARGEGGWENADRSCRHVYVEGGQAPPPESSNDGEPVKCWVNNFTVTPSSVRKGDAFHLSGQGQCDGNARASRFTVDGNPFGEFGGYQTSADLSTNDISAGNHELCFVITGGDWSDAAKSCVTGKITENEASSNEVTQGEQTTNDIAGQTDLSGPDNSVPNYFSSDYYAGWDYMPDRSRVYVPSGIDRLRFRVGAGYDQDVYGYVQEGDWYLLISENNGWAEIRTFDGTVGWIDKQYVRIDHIEPKPEIVETATKVVVPTATKKVVTTKSSSQEDNDNSWFFESPVQADMIEGCDARRPFNEEPDCFNCTEYVQTIRDDILCWLPESGADAGTWVEAAKSEKAKSFGIPEPDMNPQIGDIVVWGGENCTNLYPVGHVAIVTKVSDDKKQFDVDESNYNWSCIYKPRSNISVEDPCILGFIHQPEYLGAFPAENTNVEAESQDAVSPDTQEQESKPSFLCKYFGFIFSGFCK